MTYETIRWDLDGGILTLTLDRPDRLNAFTPRMMHELLDALDRADREDGVRVVVITGAGRGFCAGADLSGGAAVFDFDTRPDKAALGSPVRADGSIDYGHEAVRDNGGRVSLRIFRSLKPVIGAINGAAVGIGMTMTLPMDIRLAAQGARFGMPFTRRGIVLEGCSSWFLPRIIGISRAMEWTSTGRLFSATEAHEAGLVRSVHSADDLLPAAYALAREMADGTAPVSVALTRQMLWRGMTMAEPMEAHRVESRGVYVLGRSADVREGVAAFVEKREPAFVGTVSADMPDYFPWWTERPYE
jgi:enoyl-CoA hydratase/carnithine racemase